MKVLVVGSGGREHALCHAFSLSRRVTKLFCAKGNAGIAAIAECVPIDPNDVSGIAKFAEETGIDLTFVGGEEPLALGIADEFGARGLRVIGPTWQAARLESSKSFAKEFMARHRVPTAKHAVASSPDEAERILRSGRFGGPEAPVVIKADGLAAGKGVVVASSREEAIAACRGLESLVGAKAAGSIVIEEFLSGRELSLLAFVDGESAALMPPVRDHKRIGDGDTGPNTGGMGTVSDDRLLTDELRRTIIDRMIGPTLRGCREEGFPFSGILFLGLMLTDDGPKLLEYNVRFGDPETQAIMVRLQTDLVDICDAVSEKRLNDMTIRWSAGASACVVLAAEGYPARPRGGDAIGGLEKASGREGVNVFHAGTAFTDSGEVVTAGGRVLGVTAVGQDVDEALEKAYDAVADIHWPGMQFRRDIGR